MTACLAIDIGGTKIAAAILTFDGQNTPQIAERVQIRTPQKPTADALEAALAEILQTYKGKFDKVSVASTGIIQNGVLTALNPKNLGDLAFFPLKEAIAKHTDKPIVLLNDAQAAACAEYLRQTDTDNFAFITVSTGVGGGVILGGKLFTGNNGVAGHIGHSLADPNGEVCGCGRVGCVEAVAAGRAIAREAAKWQSPCEPPEVFARFRQGDAQAGQLVDKSAKAIANLIADLKISLDIECVALGGSVGLAEGYLTRVQHFLAEIPAIYVPKIVHAHYAQDAGLIGAAWWAAQAG